VLLGRFPPGPAPVLARSANDASSEARGLRVAWGPARHVVRGRARRLAPRRPGAARRQRTVADV